MLVGLDRLSALSDGSPGVTIGLVDGPVDLGQDGLAGAHIHSPADGRGSCSDLDSPACRHATFLASLLVGTQDQPPALCRRARLLVQPVFPGAATARDVAAAVRAAARGGAHVINLSLTATAAHGPGDGELLDALDECLRRDVLVVAAAGNDSQVGASLIVRHPWVISVGASTEAGFPSAMSNLGSSISRGGLLAPGGGLRGRGPSGQTMTMGGTSVATVFVTGAAAQLRSLFPRMSGGQVREALIRRGVRRRSVVPPLLDAWASYLHLSAVSKGDGRG